MEKYKTTKIHTLTLDEWKRIPKTQSYQIEDTLVYKDNLFINLIYLGSEIQQEFEIFINYNEDIPQLYIHPKYEVQLKNVQHVKTISFQLTPYFSKNQKFNLLYFHKPLIYKEYWS